MVGTSGESVPEMAIDSNRASKTPWSSCSCRAWRLIALWGIHSACLQCTTARRRTMNLCREAQIHWSIDLELSHLVDFPLGTGRSTDLENPPWDWESGTPKFHFWVKFLKQIQNSVTGGWFGTWILFFHILGIIIPTDWVIFFRGVGSTTNRYII